MPLSHLTNFQLINLFKATVKSQWTARNRAILDELASRGIYFNIEREDLFTQAAWKQRFGEDPPTAADYVVYLRGYMPNTDEIH
jgi:hypothetical protein